MLFSILIIIVYFFLYTVSHIHVCKLYVELSASSISYFIYLPIVVKAWKLCGYNSIVILVYHNLCKSIIYIRNELRKLGSDVYYLKINNSISTHYASKLARIYGFAASKKTRNCDYMILSDADMIPISKLFFSDINYGKLTLKSFGPNGYGYGNNKGRWAMCYIIANKYIWKDILKKDINDENIKYIIQNLIIILLQKGEKYFENFLYLDEVYMRDRIKEWMFYNSNVLFHTRNYYKTRINRSKWPKNISVINKTNIIDMHLPNLPNDTQKLADIWIKKIIPLQNFLFNSTPFGLNYLENIKKYNC